MKMHKSIHKKTPSSSTSESNLMAPRSFAKQESGPNKTGLPDQLKAGIENLSGYAMDNVRVHYSSDKPAQLQAHAYTQGTDIHIAAGQEKHLPHEAWHVVQQMRERVKPTLQTEGRKINDDKGLEHEADVMGIQALQGNRLRTNDCNDSICTPSSQNTFDLHQSQTIQRAGDKVAFEKVDSEKEEEEDKKLQEIIKAVIDDHQKKKKDFKDNIEAEKDTAIESIPKADTEGMNRDDQKDEIEKKERKPKRAALRAFVAQYEKSGWHLRTLIPEILKQTSYAVKIGLEKDGEIPILSKKNKQKIYSIFLGEKRFAPQDTSDSVFIKKGTQKEYVKDARGTFIPRFASRGCSIQQLETLYKRGTLHPRNPTDIIGEEQHTKYDFGNRKPTDKMSQREREFVQLRDGSGDNQRFLSITHAKAARKVFGNHGEMFTSEVIIKLDLAQIPSKLIFNQHLEESREGMVALKNKERNTSETRELGNAIYSVIKNRETLLSEIPKKAVTAVKVANGAWLNPHQAMMAYDKSYKFEFERKQRAERQAAAEKAARQKRAQEKKEAEERKEKQASSASETLAEKVDDKIKKMKSRQLDKLGLTNQVIKYLKEEGVSSFISLAFEEGKLKLSDQVDDIFLQVIAKLVQAELEL